MKYQITSFHNDLPLCSMITGQVLKQSVNFLTTYPNLKTAITKG